MGLTNATLQDVRVTRARVPIPAWGRWYAEASLDGEHVLRGPVTLRIADLSLNGTVLSGGAFKGRSSYRIVAGAGGWGKPLKRKDYQTDGGVRLANVLGDAAAEVGETLAPIDPSIRIGSAWSRVDGEPAVSVLEQLAPHAWYIDEAGITQLGARPPSTLSAAVTHVNVDRATATATIASDSIATILPGVVVDELVAVDVLHELSAKGGLRTTIYGSLDGGGSSSRNLTALRKLAEALDPFRRFRGTSEYRVVSVEGTRLNLQAVRVSTGMPDQRRVRVYPGVAGCEAEVDVGTRVLVTFIDASPSRPVVTHFEDVDGDGFMPVSLTFAKGTAGVARVGDHVTITQAQLTAAGAAAAGSPVAIAHDLVCSITDGSSKVRCG